VQRLKRGQKDEDPINQALTSAVHAFSMRWLKQSKPTSEIHDDRQAQEKLSSNVWHQARQKIESAMSTPTYRSILALHIFGLTPVPPDRPDEQIRDLCTEIALNHHKRLYQENLGDVSSNLRSVSVTGFDPEGQQKQFVGLDVSSLQDMLYWFGVLEDTSRSVRRSCPSIISDCTGVWNLVEINKNRFEETFGSLRFFDEPTSDDTATMILKHASASNKMFWAAIGRVQDAAKLCQPLLLEIAVSNAFQRLARFDEVFRLLLDRCSRDILLLNEQNQLGYCESL
jgi:hypothetical protein